MVLIKEYRICMPLSVEEYQVGQLYMIAKHSLEQSSGNEGVETVENREHDDPVHGKGHYTEKRIHLSSRLPYWIQAICPRVFYVTEKSWNFYPFTITEYTCTFLPKLNIKIYTKYENNNGNNDDCLNSIPDVVANDLPVDHVDIAFDEIEPKHYKAEEDPKTFKSLKTNRGPLIEDWRNMEKPIMCSYKKVHASFEVWGLQTKVEDFIHRCIREFLLVGHRQAFTWIDEWFDMSLNDVREYERTKQAETNAKVLQTDNIVEGGLAVDQAEEITENVIATNDVQAF